MGIGKCKNDIVGRRECENETLGSGGKMGNGETKQ